ncbi:family 10 glycosylhydrolase [Chitinophaga lutea]
MQKFLLSITLAALILGACHTSRPPSATTPASPVSSNPTAPREFRAAWVATVANINWPSKPGIPVAQQQEEAIRLLDFLKDHHYNAVVFQVRPQADALYQSKLEPWSYYLTGRQGQAPEPFYDPLTFWVEAAHARGLELHVWLNPYRAHHVVGGEVGDSSLVKRFPDLVVKLKEGYWWFDPAKKGTQDHAAAVVNDIVKRYDIDGVHFDDYFYPYPSYNFGDDFPDDDSWNAYRKSGGKLSRADWRRDAVNTFIERVYRETKATKPHVKFGLSPFGVWRPGHPPSIGGFDQYNELYADAKLWLNKGWIDYYTPQLYWPITNMSVSFPVLLGWWQRENTMQRHLWPGMSVGADTSLRTVTETANQIMITRGMLPNSMGAVHWHIGSVMKNPNMQKMLLTGPYKQDAIVPASPWLDNTPPPAPALNIRRDADSLRLNWTLAQGEDAFRWVIYARYGNSWQTKVLTRGERFAAWPLRMGSMGLAAVGVTAVDRTGNESPWKGELVAVDISPRSSWNANPPKPYKQHTPNQITIHHEGTKFDSSRVASQFIRNVQVWGMGKDRNWVDIPYHFLIARDGTIYEGRDPKTVGETATEYDPTGHLLITCLGNMEEQQPTPAQLDALVRLTAAMCKQYNISPSTIASHRDHSHQTTCPGKNLYKFFQDGTFRERVEVLTNLQSVK